MKRIFLIILDSLGIGEAPDAKSFGDEGANTLRSAYNTGLLNLPNLEKLGLGNIDGHIGEQENERGVVGAAPYIRNLRIFPQYLYKLIKIW